ncbi:hypothetical protein evm_006827 [Chilo suppressalis]|nr:hypothetical protein evm_006827 [Chilo suppressalis]
MFLWKSLLCITMMILWPQNNKSSSIESIIDSVAELSKLASSSSSSYEDEKALKDYLKHVAKKQRKFVVQQHRQKMEEHENAQVKYFDDLLKGLKKLNLRRKSNQEQGI